MARDSDLKGAVQEQAGNVAANYLTSAVHAQGEDLPVMVQAANLRGDERVLDAGCGAGHTAASFSPHVAEVVALDFTDAMLRQVEVLASERGLSNVSTRLGDVESLPFADAVFGLVVSRYSSHHWARPEQALREFRRVLRGDGSFVPVTYWAFRRFVATPTCYRGYCGTPPIVRTLRLQSGNSFFTSAGFELEVIFPYRIFLDFEEWTERMATPEASRVSIRALYDAAPAEVKKAMGIVEAGHSFQCAVLRGTIA